MEQPAGALEVVRSIDSPWRAAVGAALQSEGLRDSQVRAAILDWIAAMPPPFTAEQVVREVVGGLGLGSRPTVYRTIDWLRGGGWLTRLHNDDVERGYVRTLPGSYHLVCTGCGGIQILSDLDLALLLGPHLQALGFELCNQHLELYGRCRDCSAPACDPSDLH
ncbi:MAG: hypothetical protein HGA65_17905 [Oscillochloris sp.]|nr:hypothetical protein [Oscillochloris sp.]